MQDEVIDTNLRGTYLCSRLALPGMMRRVIAKQDGLF
jgi:NAD(P)-dependent dehydrogenase (short-subunit alcohol dehydrogenase family)